MPFCLRCSDFDCQTTGLISISTTPNSSVKPIEDDGCQPIGGGNQYVPGPGSVSVGITAYAFELGQDKWLGSRCKGSVQASQTNILKYDAITDKWWFIPSRIHRAQIQGDVGGSCTLGNVMFEGTVADAQLMNGVSITTEMGVQIGAVLNYTGAPLPLSLPDLNTYTINLKGNHTGYLSSFSLTVDYPTPAVVNYGFECMLDNTTSEYNFFTFDCG